jgi:hypothetical protein
MDPSPTAIPVVRPQVQWHRYLRGIMIEPSTALNETAADFFERIDGERSLEDIATEMMQLYDVEKETVISDVIAMAKELYAQQILAFSVKEL